MIKEVVTNLERLREVALDQHGFVTTAQALDEGVSHAELSKMVARGRLEREAYGVYRVPQVTATPWDNWALAVLWASVPEACLSYETALAAWGISDVNPDRIHICVGKNRRIRRANGRNYIVHYHNLSPKKRTWFEQIPISDVPTTIENCIDWGTPSYLIKQALERAGRTGQLLKIEQQLLAERLEDRDYGGR